MKKIIILVAMLSLCLGLLFAQPVFGLRAGLNIASLTGEDDMDNYGSKLGFHAGAMMQYPVGGNVILQPELLYTMKGGTFELEFVGKNEITGTANYIEMPLLVKYNVEMPSIKIQPYIGASIGYLLVAEIENKNTLLGVTTTSTKNVIDDMEALEAGLNFGADVIVMQNMMVGLRYNMGLTEIVKKDTKFKNNVIMVNLGFLFGN